MGIRELSEREYSERQGGICHRYKAPECAHRGVSPGGFSVLCGLVINSQLWPRPTWDVKGGQLQSGKAADANVLGP